jgi:hypothetical protein
MKLSFSKLVFLGVFLEVLILLVSYLLHPELEETFRYASRYSGRLSALVFLYGFYLYADAFPQPLDENVALRNIIRLFAILHIIHFGFLATNVYLNEIPLIPVKLIGGALAYLMIVLAPFKLHQVKVPFQLTYFYYVTFVMIMTYIARAKGDFVGAEPFWFHYLALFVFLLSAIVFAVMMRKASKK